MKRRFTTSERGLFEPPPITILLILATLGLLLPPALYALDLLRGPFSIAVLAAPALAVLIVKWVQVRRFGRNGKPLASFDEEGLLIGSERLAIDQFSQLIVYGPHQSRVLRFVRQDGSHREIDPLRDEQTVDAIAGFIRNRLGSTLAVRIEKPQTGFAKTRGDGPWDETPTAP